MAETAASARASIETLKERLQRTTMRERLLLGGLMLGLAFYAPVAALEARSTQADAYIDALGEQSTARLTAAAARRIADGAADRLALEDMNAWGFEAANPAVAQVLIEQRLLEALNAAGLPNARIVTNAKVEAIGPTQWLDVEVQSDLRWDPAFAFMDKLGEWPEGFRVVGFRYELTPPGPMMVEDGPPQTSGKLWLRLAFPVRLTDAGTPS
ncbi:hypothetical protein [Brevundimonas guildfordensis]|uniref:General secretion pathway protein GspM n=1 Tax=Brevundimonas guildfordensis TaxID=2762241 RepID=A0ABR8R0T6_9CAUL|nr:hypothetical protein [Brevundimonas guildfordensis]MBD7941338.1 hypothetical protein [Brevundimonas guildfordensis]